MFNEIKITNTEIINNAEDIDENGNYDVSSISVLVKIKIKDKNYYLDFQPDETADYGAISSGLSPYDGTEDYDKLEKIFGDDFQKAIKYIKEKSKARALWEEYIDEEYVRDVEFWGGMDANSENHKMKKR